MQSYTIQDTRFVFETLYLFIYLFQRITVNYDLRVASRLKLAQGNFQLPRGWNNLVAPSPFPFPKTIYRHKCRLGAEWQRARCAHEDQSSFLFSFSSSFFSIMLLSFALHLRRRDFLTVVHVAHLRTTSHQEAQGFEISRSRNLPFVRAGFLYPFKMQNTSRVSSRGRIKA